MSPPPVSVLDRAIGRLCVVYRQRLDISQATFAESVNAKMDLGGPNWTQATVSKVESGKRGVMLHEAMALADVFEMNVNDMLKQAVFYLENQ